MTFGTVTNFEESATVRFERLIDQSPETVWEALVKPELLAEWLAPATFDGFAGGSVALDFDEDQKVTGTVLVWEPPSVLEYSWTFTGESDSMLRFELTAVESGTRLVLEHRLLPPDQAVGYGAGWHAHLDILEATVMGSEPADWDERFNAVLGNYAGA